MPKSPDLTGIRFGHLVVLSRSNDKGKNSKWLCKCDCGKEMIVSRPSLKRGQKSCGCFNPKPKPAPRKLDLLGKKFNMLTAIEWLGGDESYWLCKCECGNERKVQRHDLLRMKAKSCGCKKPEHHIFDKNDLLNKIEKTNSCWLWKGSFRKNGYGQCCINQKSHTAHRASWIFHKEENPKGKLICHTCDNRACVNPDHLYLGDHKTNARDRELRNPKKRERKNGAYC